MASMRARNSTLLRIFSGCVTSMPAARAACFTGVAKTSCVRPTGRSGCETTRATLWPAAMSASSVDPAKRGVPQKTSFTALPRALTLHLANLAQRKVALERAHAEDEEYTVEMVDFMLKGTREQFLSIHFEPLAVRVLRPNTHLGGAGNLLANLRETQTALFL